METDSTDIADQRKQGRTSQADMWGLRTTIIVGGADRADQEQRELCGGRWG